MSGYEVYISTDGKSFKNAKDVKAGSDYCVISNLTKSTVYYIKICGYVNFEGEKIHMESESETQKIAVK